MGEEHQQAGKHHGRHKSKILPHPRNPLGYGRGTPEDGGADWRALGCAVWHRSRAEVHLPRHQHPAGRVRLRHQSFGRQQGRLLPCQPFIRRLGVEVPDRCRSVFPRALGKGCAQACGQAEASRKQGQPRTARGHHTATVETGGRQALGEVRHRHRAQSHPCGSANRVLVPHV